MVEAVALIGAEKGPPTSRFRGHRFVSTVAVDSAGNVKLVSELTTGDPVRLVTLTTAGKGALPVPLFNTAPDTIQLEVSGHESPVGYMPEGNPTDDQAAPPSVVRSST